jgi:hypothetical protein
MKKLITTMWLVQGALAAQTGEIRGTITNELKQPVPFATVRVLQDKHLVGGAQTDDEGAYVCKSLTPGHYELLITDPGHVTQPVRDVTVIPNDATYVDVTIQSKALDGVDVVAKAIDYTKSGAGREMYSMVTMDAEELNRNASYSRGDVEGALEAMTSEVISGPRGEVHFRGSRDGASGFFVDGTRTMEAATLPGGAIENITVFRGGLPAMYGDVMGGAVIITTKNYFSGIREKNIRAQRKRDAEE